MGLGTVISKLGHLVSRSILFTDFRFRNNLSVHRKDIYIEGRNGAVIRDVLVFTSVNSQQPDDTDQTTWTLQTRVYFDYNSVEDEGFLLLQRLDGEFSARIPVSFRNETAGSGSVFRDIAISIPVTIYGICVYVCEWKLVIRTRSFFKNYLCMETQMKRN